MSGFQPDDLGPESVVEQAFKARIQADAVLNARLTGVFDFRQQPERGLAYPYVTIGDTHTSANDGGPNDYSAFGDTQGYDIALTIHIWSIQEGSDECKLIRRRLIKLFNKPRGLVVEGYGLVGSLYETSYVLSDPDDDRVTHMPVTFRVGIQEEAA